MTMSFSINPLSGSLSKSYGMVMNALDSQFMKVCLELALNGLGNVSPNPLVGSVIVHQGVILGQGYHTKFGSAHAEIEAISNVENRELLEEATLYVNLEPCSHYGKTPPCTQAIIDSKIKRVVFGSYDLNTLVRENAGLERLRSHGIEVCGPILEKDCLTLNRRFITNIQEKRPYVILKWAQTSDGFIARCDYSSKWISSESSRKLTHQWRSQEDAILVGTMTALQDDPKLNTRLITNGRDPLRVILDKDQKIPKTHHLFDQSQRTLIVSKDCSSPEHQYIKWPEGKLWPELLSELYRKNVGSIIIEGGSKTLQSLIDESLWDEARIFTSEEKFGEGISAPTLTSSVKGESHKIASDSLQYYYHKRTESA